VVSLWACDVTSQIIGSSSEIGNQRTKCCSTNAHSHAHAGTAEQLEACGALSAKLLGPWCTEMVLLSWLVLLLSRMFG